MEAGEDELLIDIAADNPAVFCLKAVKCIFQRSVASASPIAQAAVIGLIIAIAVSLFC